jgi:hypothetical protein
MSSTPDPDAPDALRAENARLIGLLEAHGIQWRRPPAAAAEQVPSRLSTDEKVRLFGQLFRGRTDVYPIRWEAKTSGKSGYSPACANEWRPGVCEKPRTKCGDCGHRDLLPLSDSVLFKHLAGEHTIGTYPLLTDDTCHFLAVDFDEAEWRDDAIAFARTAKEAGVPVALEVSRSGNGAHAWIFFDRRVSARDARRLGTALISRTCARNRQLRLTSYDRLFPNQDTMPKGGLPRQHPLACLHPEAMKLHARVIVARCHALHSHQAVVVVVDRDILTAPPPAQAVVDDDQLTFLLALGRLPQQRKVPGPRRLVRPDDQSLGEEALDSRTSQVPEHPLPIEAGDDQVEVAQRRDVHLAEIVHLDPRLQLDTPVVEVS